MYFIGHKRLEHSVSVPAGHGEGPGIPPPPPPPPNCCRGIAPPRPPPPQDYSSNYRRNSIDSITTFHDLHSLHSGETDDESEGETSKDAHVLKPSDMIKGRRRKNIPSEGGESSEKQNKLKAGAQKVLPFVPPKFPKKSSSKGIAGDGDQLMKPSEYLKSLNWLKLI